MILTVDNERVQTELPHGCTLEEVIDEVRGGMEGRLIVSVALNGQQQSDAELTNLLQQPVPDDTQVDLESSDARQLVSNALEGLAAEYNQAGQQHEQIIELLSSGNATAGIQAIGQHIALWQTCQRVIAQCATLLNVDITEWVLQERPLKAWFEEVIERLVEVRNALESHDLVLLADVVRYELPELCRTWEALLRDLAQTIRNS